MFVKIFNSLIAFLQRIYWACEIHFIFVVDCESFEMLCVLGIDVGLIVLLQICISSLVIFEFGWVSVEDMTFK
jgi:hypothetical protein